MQGKDVLIKIWTCPVYRRLDSGVAGKSCEFRPDIDQGREGGKMLAGQDRYHLG